MKRLIRLTESDLHNIVIEAVSEIMSTIQLQFINGYFYPTDAISSETLENELGLGRIPENRLDVISAKLVKRGYKLAISNYTPKPTRDDRKQSNPYIDKNAKSHENPCPKCGLKDLCDKDDCGRKSFKLW